MPSSVQFSQFTLNKVGEISWLSDKIMATQQIKHNFRIPISAGAFYELFPCENWDFDGSGHDADKRGTGISEQGQNTRS